MKVAPSAGPEHCCRRAAVAPRGICAPQDNLLQSSVRWPAGSDRSPVLLPLHEPLYTLRAARSFSDVTAPGRAVKLLFWLCLILISYAYFGYAIYLWLYVCLRRKPILQSPITPRVSIVIAARNEEASLPAKLENLRLLDYPQAQLQTIVASDGSTDRTASILRERASQVVAVILDESKGKANALTQAVKLATGDILALLDPRQTIAPNAASDLAFRFADPSVGACSGAL